MMNILKVLLISIVQGVAEFLPISSSGHILLLKKIFSLDLDVSFDITIHMGTLLSIIIIYYKDIFELIKGLLFKEYYSELFDGLLERKDYLRVLLVFIIATIPAAVAGFLLKDFINEYFVITNNKIFILVGFSFLWTAVLLTFSSLVKYKKTSIIKSISFKQSFMIGLFQMIALLPGVSRSGSTITGGLLSGVDSKEIGRFSFLLSIPLVLAAFFLEILDFLKGDLVFVNDNIHLYIIGFIVSFIVGFLSLKLLLNLIKRGKIFFFAIYLFVPIIISFLIGLS